jgi:hypothetical protein
MSDFPPSEKVRILLAEHSSLRSEIVARMGHVYQVAAVGATGVAILIALHQLMPSSFCVILALILVLGVLAAAAFWFINRDIWKAAERLREIEIDINDRAGEDLLVWEILWRSTSYWGRARTLPQSTLSGLQPPERTFRGKRLEE